MGYIKQSMGLVTGALIMIRLILLILTLLLFTGCSDKSNDINTVQSKQPVTIEQTSSLKPISSVNSPPRIVSSKLLPLYPKKDDVITAKVVSADPDSDNVLLDFEWSVNGISLDSSGRSISPSLEKGDMVKVKITPFDGTDRGTPIAKAIKITNSFPDINTELSAVSIINGKCSAKVIASDIDGDEIRYALKKGSEHMTIDRSTGELTWNIQKNNDSFHEITISVKDSEGAESNLDLTVKGCFPKNG